MKQSLPNNRTSDATPAKNSSPKRPRWGQTEGTPLPLGATWIEEERAFNFAVYAEHAESVTLSLYSADELANPVLTFRFDFLRNKSGRIWHCRLPLNEMRGARYYAYSISGQAVSELQRFYAEKVLLDPYAKSVLFPPGFDRNCATGPGPNAGKAPLGSSLAMISPSIGPATFHLATSRTRSSTNYM